MADRRDSAMHLVVSAPISVRAQRCAQVFANAFSLGPVQHDHTLDLNARGARAVTREIREARFDTGAQVAVGPVPSEKGLVPVRYC
jgi:hypothetical protein